MNDSGVLARSVEVAKPGARGAVEQRAVREAVARTRTESPLVRWLLILLALGFVGIVLIVPLAVVFVESFRQGWALYVAALSDEDARAAIRLTLLVAAISVPLNVVFGLAASWAIAKFRFKGRSVLITLIDLPFATSPVVAGLMLLLLFGDQGPLAKWLAAHNWKIIFALPGMVLATLFVTFPFVARELIAFMEAQGIEEEEAATSLGASGWQTYWRVTLPNIKWGLLYGVILCNARAMGEFGAVSLVSENAPGESSTIPLQVENLYLDHKTTAAFALASVLMFLGLVTLVVKRILEIRVHRQARAGQE